ncbi:hypothetical protein [Ruminiclostridium cellulolyticum]|uniref:Thioredoxin domain-containing protein n=1 Tax=Ruminiclostridium cellulolyticum (strain ATCC 35319 / DSM 5812 / JCM 6584 / H10) TaxID=394503 RepID=B8I1U2_RUMCH|nr:hypothetical protein [Ruminiclostridium cellulolyticum]ACL77727.1 hypothetical protein Ccel_3439 [Ruminiclostridium cellulolyticum H10]
MINKVTIQKEQALNAVKNGEFDKSVIASKEIVLIVLTQDWCPQWQAMKTWLYDSADVDVDIDIYELEYNTTDYFEEFKTFKEEQFGNPNVPYLRFYKNGTLIEQTNYISKDRFIEIIGQ